MTEWESIYDLVHFPATNGKAYFGKIRWSDDETIEATKKPTTKEIVNTFRNFFESFRPKTISTWEMEGNFVYHKIYDELSTYGDTGWLFDGEMNEVT